MENINSMGHVFRHPDYYKKLKASLKKEAISPDSATVDEGRAPSSKRQAIEETVPHCDIEEATSNKQLEASSFKRDNKKDRHEKEK